MGNAFCLFLGFDCYIENLAKNGRSTSSFRNEGLWKKVLDEATEGDYVFIQFGHNDEVPTKKTYTTEPEFKNNLKAICNRSKREKSNTHLAYTNGKKKI